MYFILMEKVVIKMELQEIFVDSLESITETSPKPITGAKIWDVGAEMFYYTSSAMSLM